MAFSAPVDIANRAAQQLGAGRIADFTSNAVISRESAFAYDKLRRAELRRNTWRFATRRTVLRSVGPDTLLWTPPTWAAGTFSVGSITAYTPTSGVYSGQSYYWQTSAAKTSGDTTTPDSDADWHRYFGPVAVDLYDADISYLAGEIVIVPAAWSGATTYAANDVVASSTTWYVSLAGSNTNHAVTDTDWWVPWTNDGRSSDGSWGLTAGDTPTPLGYPGTERFYLSLSDGNEDNPLDTGARWLLLNGTGAALQINYPIGLAASANATSSVYHLPHGFLRQAPRDPKAAVGAPGFGAIGGPRPTDWLFEGNYIVSRENGPIMLRFVADVIDVPDMDDMFCEGLAARLADELCEHVTQASDKRALARRTYDRLMGEARLVNGIETGTQDPPEDDFIIVRY